MATKKTKKKIMSSQRDRKKSVTIDKLRGIVARAEACCGELVGLLEAMSDNKIDTVDVDGVNLADRGADLMERYIDNFTKAMKTEIRKAKLNKTSSD